MQEGIDKCKGNITNYLQDAVLIANTGRFYHALICLEFALEEFGKILLLKETMNKNKNDPVEIDGYEFCNHNRKADRALANLDPAQKFRVLFSPMWERGIWEVGVWEETVIGDRTRLDCSFVDFINNNWTLGKDIDKTYFQDLARVIEQGLKMV